MTTSKKKEPTPEHAGRSLQEFALAKRRESCVVCGVPEALREQLRTARDKKIPRDVVVEWLEKDHGYKVSADDLTSHTNGKHP